MKNTHLAGTLCASLAAATLFSGSSQAAPVPLTFDTVTQSLNDNNVGGLGAGCTNCTVMNFTDIANVGTSGLDIDMLVTWALVNDPIDTIENTGFMTANRGIIPNYTSGGAEPNDDFGFLYDGITVVDGDAYLGAEAGVTFTFEFFTGDGSFSTPYEIEDLELLVYDVDGSGTIPNGCDNVDPSQCNGTITDAHQDEWVDAYTADGLVSYALGSTPQALEASAITGGYRFTGPGGNYAEDDASGAAILRYMNTSSVSLAFGSYAYPDTDRTTDAVFSAIDGNLSLIDPNDFGDPVAVPEPSVLWLLGTGLIGITILRRRKDA